MSSINTNNTSIVSQGGQVTQPSTTQNPPPLQEFLHVGAGADLHEHTIEKMLEILDDPGFNLNVLNRLVDEARNFKNTIEALHFQISHERKKLENPDITPVDKDKALAQITLFEEQLKIQEAGELELKPKLELKLHAYFPKIIESVNKLILDLHLPHDKQIKFYIEQFDNSKIKQLEHHLISYWGYQFFQGNTAFHIERHVNYIIYLQNQRTERLKEPQEQLAILKKDLLKKDLTENEKFHINFAINYWEKREREIIADVNHFILRDKVALLETFKDFLFGPGPRDSSVQEKVASTGSDQGLFGLHQPQNQKKVKSKTKKMKPKKNRGTKV
ncbi:MAG: hypothetical protein H0W88_05610 [Parachlamydiaceae bacterium]|nr:hypothetical protein [Parachlamydiaceae bacterium]